MGVIKFRVRARYNVGDESETTKSYTEIAKHISMYYPDHKLAMDKAVECGLLVIEATYLFNLDVIEGAKTFAHTLVVESSRTTYSFYKWDIMSIEVGGILDDDEQYYVDHILNWYTNDPVVFEPTDANMEDRKLDSDLNKCELMI